MIVLQNSTVIWHSILPIDILSNVVAPTGDLIKFSFFFKLEKKRKKREFVKKVFRVY